MALPPSADILESFDTHHPLVLPDGGYQFQLGRAVTDSALGVELDKLNDFISTLSRSQSNAPVPSVTEEQKVQTNSSNTKKVRKYYVLGHSGKQSHEFRQFQASTIITYAVVPFDTCKHTMMSKIVGVTL